jgi:biopolymer transport protein ExbB
VDELSAEEAAEAAEDPYSFQHMWEQGDVVARSTLIVLILMFSATWYIIVTKTIDQTRLISQGKRLQAFWAAPTVSEGLNRLGPKNPYRPMASLADLQAQERAEGLAGRIAVRRRAEIDLGRSIDYINTRLQSGMSVLATVGATAPFVGLLGTVWGIRNALIELGLSGEPSIERIAGPVGEALLMTAIGLIVAVPAVFLYNVLGRRNKKVIDTVRAFAADVDAYIISSAP